MTRDAHDDLNAAARDPAVAARPTDLIDGGQGNGHHAPADDDEIVFYEGSPLLRGELGLVLLWFAVGLAVAAIPVIWEASAEYGAPWWSWGLILVGLLLMFVPALWVKRHRYRVTNYRIDYEFGLLSTNIDTLELWHVNDIRMHQSLVDRVFGVGTILVDADDRSTPHLELRSLARPRTLYENLKQRVIAVKRQRGVIKMDTGF